MTEQPEGLAPGMLLDGRFEIIEHVADGGMGAIYRARVVPDGQIIAIKSLHDEWLENDEARARFEREAEAAARLEHPGIIVIYGHGVDPSSRCYMAMEWLEGMSLEELMIEEGALHEDYAVAIILQAAESLAFAHREDVVHRDIKPDNIFIIPGDSMEEDRVKVLDFGIAKIQDPSLVKITRAGTICGTPEFMSPEQSTGTQVDHRSDVYSLGCVLYAVLVGEPPFMGATHYETMFKHQLEPVPDLPEDLPATLNQIIQRATAKKPDDRYETMDAMTAALRAFLKDPREAPAPTSPAPTSPAPTSPAPTSPAPTSPAPSKGEAKTSAPAKPQAKKPALATPRTPTPAKPARPPAKVGPPRGLLIVVGLLAMIVVLLIAMTLL